MSQQKQTGRKTKSIVRMPATKCAHLRKRMEKSRYTEGQRRWASGGK
jgi:hypothetical protein